MRRLLDQIGPMFTDMWSVDPRRLELFSLPEIVDHLEYMGAKGARRGHQT